MKGVVVLAVAICSVLNSAAGEPWLDEDSLPLGVTAPNKSAIDYRLTFHQPKNCKPEKCTVFVAIDTNEGNSSYLDIYIEGKSDGWMAVGFTKTPNMFGADVIACNLNPNESRVELLDTFNADSKRHNSVDEIQESYLFSSKHEDGRISCSFGRSISGTGTNESFDLDDEYYILLGRAIKDPVPGKLVPHVINSPDPAVIKTLVNPVQSEGAEGSGYSTFESVSIRVHGIVMIIAWAVLVTSGIFFAAHLHPALPNGQWFQFHRALMIAGLILGIAGFILIFVAQIDNPTPGLIHIGTVGALIRVRTAHFAIGILVMFLQILNPIISFLRCKPGSRYRWIYNYIHGTVIGSAAIILAYANMGTGLTIFSTGFSRWSDLTLLWVFIGYVALLTILEIGIYYYTRVYKADRSVQALINAEKNEERSSLLGKDKPASDSKLRWALFGIYTTVNVGFSIALIVMVALPQ